MDQIHSNVVPHRYTRNNKYVWEISIFGYWPDHSIPFFHFQHVLWKEYEINGIVIRGEQHIFSNACFELTHRGQVTHICISKLTITGSDNGLSPGRRQAIIWSNAGILLIRTLGTNFSEIVIEIQTFSLKKMRLKMSSGKWRPFCLGLNVLTGYVQCFTPRGSIDWESELVNSSPLDKMAAISQKIFSDAFLWMKSFVFWFKFHWSLFLGVQLTITRHWLR